MYALREWFLTAKPNEARDEIPIGKVFFEDENMFGNMVFYPACLLRRGECF